MALEAPVGGRTRIGRLDAAKPRWPRGDRLLAGIRSGRYGKPGERIRGILPERVSLADAHSAFALDGPAAAGATARQRRDTSAPRRGREPGGSSWRSAKGERDLTSLDGAPAYAPQASSPTPKCSDQHGRGRRRPPGSLEAGQRESSGRWSGGAGPRDGETISLGGRASRAERFRTCSNARIAGSLYRASRRA